MLFQIILHISKLSTLTTIALLLMSLEIDTNLDNGEFACVQCLYYYPLNQTYITHTEVQSTTLPLPLSNAINIYHSEYYNIVQECPSAKLCPVQRELFLSEVNNRDNNTGY